MECSRCHDNTPILVSESDLCWTCAFSRPFDLAAQQHALADERQAAVAKAAGISKGDHGPISNALGGNVRLTMPVEVASEAACAAMGSCRVGGEIDGEPLLPQADVGR